MATVWSFPTRIVFGVGEAKRVGAEATALGVRRALIVTDQGVVQAGLLEPVQRSLEEAGVATAVFAEVEGNPGEDNIERGAEHLRAHGADGVIAIGGGSPLDAGKLIALRAKCQLPFEQLDDAIDGGRHIPKDLPPLITLPTTAGTGSEVGRSGVVTVRSTGRKTVVFSPHLLARVAILDPELTRSMPPRTTAATGFDALTHCVEAYLSRGDHPMADAIAVSGIDLVVNNLRQAVDHGDDLLARGNMMKAAMMGAVAFQKGLGACHSLAHPLSSELGLHHGLANALCLPAVLDFNEESAPDRVFHVALLLGAEPARGACARAIRELRSAIGLPNGLAEAGVRPEHLDRLTELAELDACHQSNPRACTRADLRRLYELSM